MRYYDIKPKAEETFSKNGMVIERSGPYAYRQFIADFERRQALLKLTVTAEEYDHRRRVLLRRYF